MSNRVIKFRVWDKIHKKMLTQKGEMWLGENELGQCASSIISFLVSCDGCYLPQGNKYAVEQFTGLFDKNGKEIYEGDIVKDSGAVYQVLFGPYEDSLSQQVGIGFYLEQTDRFFQPLCQKDKFVVLGNVHENPEFLKP